MHALWQEDPMHLQNVSSQVSLRNPRRLTCAETFFLLPLFLHIKKFLVQVIQRSLRQSSWQTGFSTHDHRQNNPELFSTNTGAMKQTWKLFSYQLFTQSS